VMISAMGYYISLMSRAMVKNKKILKIKMFKKNYLKKIFLCYINMAMNLTKISLINELKESKNFYSKASKNAFIKKINTANNKTLDKLKYVSKLILNDKITFKLKDIKKLFGEVDKFKKIEESLNIYTFDYTIDNYKESISEINLKIWNLFQERPDANIFVYRIFEGRYQELEGSKKVEKQSNFRDLDKSLFWFHFETSDTMYADVFYDYADVFNDKIIKENHNKIYTVKIKIFNKINISDYEANRILQNFSDSNDELLCVVKSIIKFCKSKWNEDTRKIYYKITRPIYNKTYNIQELEELGKELKVSFKIVDFFNKPIEVNIGKNKYCIELLNLRYNHLEFSKKKEIEISIKESHEIMENSKYYYKEGNKLNVLDFNYKIKDDFGDIFSDFIESNNLNNNYIKCDSEEFKYINSCYILTFQFFNSKLINEYNENRFIEGEINDDLGLGGVMKTIIKNDKIDNEYLEYDLYKAYYTTTNNSIYGVPSNAFLYYDSDYKNEIETHIKNNFVGFYNITLLNKIDYIFEDLTHTLTTPQIMILIKHNIKFIINNCLIAPKINIKFKQETTKKINKYGELSEKGISIYAKISGILLKNELIKTTEIKTDTAEEYSKIISQKQENIIISTNGDIIKIENHRNLSIKHVGLFINSNTSAFILDCLLENYENIENIMGVKLDSIILKKSNFNFVHSELFKVKKANIENIIDSINIKPFIEKIELVNNCKELKFNDTLIKSNFILFSGKGGSGKTESIFNNINHDYIIYTALAWERGSDIRNKYNEKITISSIPKILNVKGEIQLVKRKDFKYIVVDEITLLSEDTIMEIKRQYPDKIIILLGDVDEDGFYYQCSLNILDNFKVINPSNHRDLQIIKYTKNYRFTEELNNLLDDLRKEMKLIYQNNNNDIIKNKKLEKYVENKFKSCYYKKEQVKFNKNDMGIACLQESKINFKYTKYFLNEDNKKYVVEKTRILSNIFKGNETDEKNGELRLFSTIHATQGKTCPIGNNVIIIIDKYFDFNLYYTALSRAKTLNQIYIIKDFN